MRSKILMYLFIFALLFCIFIYVNDKKILDSKTDEIEMLKEKIGDLESSDNSEPQTEEETYFSLENNEDAITYFDKKGLDYNEVMNKIEDKLLSNNSASKDNPLIPVAGMDGYTHINKIRILNHKWVIADFTDGTYWGEVFYSYMIQENEEIELIPEKSFIYPLN